MQPSGTNLLMADASLSITPPPNKIAEMQKLRNKYNNSGRSRMLLAFRDIRDYFKKNSPSNGGYHIKGVDLRAALIHLYHDTHTVCNLLAVNDKSRSLLKSLQSEGRYDDGFISMRDLYAASRGTGFDGENIEDKLFKLYVHLVENIW